MRKPKLIGAAAVLAAGALALAGCSTPTPSANQSSAINSTKTASVAWNQAFYSYNNQSSFGNAVANSNAVYLMNEQLEYYTPDLKLVPNKSFGTLEKVSDKPLQVKITFAETAQWSDGTPVSATDVLMQWAAMSTLFNNYTPALDDETGDVKKANSGSKVFFNATDPGWALIKKKPVVSDDGKSITLEFSTSFVDWEPTLALASVALPAHIVGKKALGIEDNAAAATAVRTAILEKDEEALSKLSNQWNTGFNFKDMPADTELVTGNGPYTMTDLKSEQYITFAKNPNYKGEHVPTIDQINYRIIPDAQASVQALANGEVLVTQPQATADILKQLQGLSNVTTLGGEGGTFEHVDLVFDNKGPFDPDTYGGDEKKASLVREAFLQTIPRQQIIDTIIKPLNPDATIRNSFYLLQSDPQYAAVTAANGMEAKFGGGANTDKAKELLKQAGNPKVSVRMMYASNNPRRVQEFQLIKQAAADAGITVEDVGSAEWGALLDSNTKYDASLFGWQSTSTALSGNIAAYQTKGSNNKGHYSSSVVDKAQDDLLSQTDPAKVTQDLSTIEKQLVDDNYGTVIFQFPQPTGVSSKITGITSMALAPTYFWNFWEWKLS